MALPRAQLTSTVVRSAIAGQSFLLGQAAWTWRPNSFRSRGFATEPSSSSSSSPSSESSSKSAASSSASSSARSSSTAGNSPARDVEPSESSSNSSMPPGWEDDPDYNISAFSELPHRHFGFNQHMVINAEFKEALRQVLWQFRAPIRYAFAYGSGVFTQSSSSSSTGPSPHPNPPEAVTKWQESGGKIIDFIFGVTFTQHWHSLNLQQHRDHYSALGSLGSGIVSRVQDNFGAGAYFNPYIIVNGMMIKYGVVNLDTIYRDLSEWDTLYIAGRLQKPVKILRDDPRIRLANQVNLISALRTALLMLPDEFTERELYVKIAGLSYIGDPRFAVKAEDPRKISNIVDNQMANFRQLYLPLVDDLPNVAFNDPATASSGWAEDSSLNLNMQQDTDPVRRGNMVRRLPKAFRRKLYDQFQTIFRLPIDEYQRILDESKDENTFSKSLGGDFDRQIAQHEDLNRMVSRTVSKTVNWPTISQSFKGVLTGGFSRSWKYFGDKMRKGKELKQGAKKQQQEEEGQRKKKEKQAEEEDTYSLKEEKET